MQQQDKQIGSFFAATTLALGLVLAAPAALAEVYSWRTEDGGYAYTDDRDHVPARYTDQVKVVHSQKLEDYERFTPQDDGASDRYATRISERLSYLRALNTPQVLYAEPTAAASPQQRTLSLATGNKAAPQIDVPIVEGAGPIIVEPVLAKHTGDFRTRRVTVIRQDGKTLAVIKGNPHVFNPSNDIHDEDELEAGAPLR